MNICKLISLAGIDGVLGSYDYAVPHGWLMEDPEKRRANYWWYPYGKKKGSLFGRPLAWRTVARLVMWKMRREVSPDLHTFLQVWPVAHPGKPLDAFGETLCRKWLAAYPHEEAADLVLRWEFEGNCIPLPEFLQDPAEAPVSQAA